MVVKEFRAGLELYPKTDPAHGSFRTISGRELISTVIRHAHYKQFCISLRSDACIRAVGILLNNLQTFHWQSYTKHGSTTGGNDHFCAKKLLPNHEVKAVSPKSRAVKCPWLNYQSGQDTLILHLGIREIQFCSSRNNTKVTPADAIPRLQRWLQPTYTKRILRKQQAIGLKQNDTEFEPHGAQNGTHALEMDLWHDLLGELHLQACQRNIPPAKETEQGIARHPDRLKKLADHVNTKSGFSLTKTAWQNPRACTILKHIAGNQNGIFHSIPCSWLILNQETTLAVSNHASEFSLQRVDQFINDHPSHERFLMRT